MKKTIRAICLGLASVSMLAFTVSAQSGSWQAPGMRIYDAPASAWRANMFDMARRFIPVDTLKFFIRDYLSKYKMNICHMHFTDGYPGWTIEIKSHPELTSYRTTFYTQDQLKDLVAYAKKYFVTLVPEIEGPGHGSALTHAIPAIKCPGDPEGELLCVGKDTTYKIMGDIFNELFPIFDGVYYHAGGDEVPCSDWQNCPICSAKMASLGLTSPEDLQVYYLQKLQEMFVAHGKKMAVWDTRGNPDGKLTTDLITMLWPGGTSFPSHLYSGKGYLGVYCGYSSGYYLSCLPNTLASQILNFSADPGVNRTTHPYILGFETCCWGDCLGNYNWTEAESLWPRILALAESGWNMNCTESSNPDFMCRMAYQFLDVLGQIPAAQHGRAGSTYLVNTLNDIMNNSANPLHTAYSSAVSKYIYIPSTNYTSSYYSTPQASLIIPKPQSLTFSGNTMAINSNTAIYYMPSTNNELYNVACTVRDQLDSITGLLLQVKPQSDQTRRTNIVLVASKVTGIPSSYINSGVDQTKLSNLGKEDYFCDVTDDAVFYGGTEAGAYYAAQSFLQTLNYGQVTSTYTLAAVKAATYKVFYNTSLRQLNFAVPGMHNEMVRVYCAAYDLEGKKIATIVDGNLAAGKHALSLAGNYKLSSGMYLLNLRIGTEQLSVKIAMQ